MDSWSYAKRSIATAIRFIIRASILCILTCAVNARPTKERDMDWIMNNWQDVLSIVAYIVFAASVVVKLTPNKLDDTIVAKLLKLISLAPSAPKK